jgi:quinol monooxygenase YgiN
MRYGLVGKFTAQPGKRDELASILLRAAELLERNEDCIHYLVSTTDEANAIRVTETWTNKAAHDASLEPADVRALITQAMPLIASMSDQLELDVIGGKGL